MCIEKPAIGDRKRVFCRSDKKEGMRKNKAKEKSIVVPQNLITPALDVWYSCKCVHWCTSPLLFCLGRRPWAARPLRPDLPQLTVPRTRNVAYSAGDWHIVRLPKFIPRCPTVRLFANFSAQPKLKTCLFTVACVHRPRKVSAWEWGAHSAWRA